MSPVLWGLHIGMLKFKGKVTAINVYSTKWVKRGMTVTYAVTGTLTLVPGSSMKTPCHWLLGGQAQWQLGAGGAAVRRLGSIRWEQCACKGLNPASELQAGEPPCIPQATPQGVLTRSACPPSRMEHTLATCLGTSCQSCDELSRGWPTPDWDNAGGLPTF